GEDARRHREERVARVHRDARQPAHYRRPRARLDRAARRARAGPRQRVRGARRSRGDPRHRAQQRVPRSDSGRRRARLRSPRAEAAEEEARKAAERRSARLAELAEQAVQAAALDDVAAARRLLGVVRKEWNSLVAAGAAPSEADQAIVERYAEADRSFSARDAAARSAEDRTRRDALTRLQQLAARTEALTARTNLSLKAGERGLKELR